MHYLIVLFAALLISLGTKVVNADFLTQQATTEGAQFPAVLWIQRGEEAMIRLTKVKANQQLCVVMSPGGDKLTANSSNHGNVMFDKSGCGIRIGNITDDDSGRWRLISSQNKDIIQGVTNVFVTDIAYDPDITHSIKVNTTGEFNLGLETAEYCVIETPNGIKSSTPESCTVLIENATMAKSGEWIVHAGVKGKTDEIVISSTIRVYDEDLDVGYIRGAESKKTLSMYCNLVDSKKTLKYCRFERESDSKGIKLIDGQGNGQYSYFGGGLAKQQCGMTIESPKAEDLVAWKCQIGIGIGDVEEVIGAVISLSDEKDEKVTTDGVTSLKEAPLTLSCKTQRRLSYCWFKHPNGSVFTATPNDNNDKYRYFGDGLLYGDCGITFGTSSMDDNGEWSCHLGLQDTVGADLVGKVSVKITNSRMVAIWPTLSSGIGESVTLACQSINNEPLKYCRFLLPNGEGFNIHEDITHNNALNDIYYFTSDYSLTRGQCAVTVKSVASEHFGTWSCFTVIHERPSEHGDEIVLAKRSLSLASVIGMSIGLVFLVAVFTVIGLHKYRIHRQTRSGEVMSTGPSPTGSLSGYPMT